MGFPTVKDQVLKQITDHPGQVIYASEIAETTKFNQGQVISAMGSIARAGVLGSQLEVVVRGRAWRYRPTPVVQANPLNKAIPPVSITSNWEQTPKKKERRMFEQIGVNKAGQAILECEDGSLWKAEQL